MAAVPLGEMVDLDQMLSLLTRAVEVRTLSLIIDFLLKII